ncbi:uncharacterized protein T551_00726 [Pneumocystis jirovecii RU7]|uniref:Ribosome biogenesis protein SLX9 n=1 Tax=Pneumocystis jirovecii (strain RU7) TaxID=1408657 RepID=A0A0W4ZUK8_PNEJ7|nr:uncharacterized protein T551_00726 [Pneumocystis jirovecii RU7]KTW32044.1 hypothetical protein T551_00726 [Pneumocystis jirovecii RU7]
MSKTNKHKPYSKKINQKLKKNIENKSNTNEITNNLSQNIFKKKTKTISKIQRRKSKHEKWMEKFKKEPILSTSFHKRINKKQKLQFLSSIKEISNSLPDIVEEVKYIKPKNSKKQIKNSQKQEEIRFNAILQHPNFQNDPWGSIRQYINNSVEKKRHIN